MKYDGSGNFNLVVNVFDGKLVVLFDVEVCFVVYDLIMVNNSIIVWVYVLGLEMFFF